MTLFEELEKYQPSWREDISNAVMAAVSTMSKEDLTKALCGPYEPYKS